MPSLASHATELEHEAEARFVFCQGEPPSADRAFECLFRTHQAEVFRWIVRIVRDRAAAEDLTVETFWRIYQARSRFRPDREFSPWARRIATRTALDWLRTQDAHAAFDTDLPHDPPAPPEPDRVLSAELRHKTAQAFARLRPNLRIAATLAVIEDQPYADIARALGITIAAVKLRVFRALRHLRADLARQGITP